MNYIKVGDFVNLINEDKLGCEAENWSKQANIPINTLLKVTEVDEKRIRVEGYRFNHPIEKFKLVNEIYYELY